MLVFSRECDQEIVIVVPPSTATTTIRCVLTDMRGRKARIGFQAPPRVSINRREIHDQIVAEIDAGSKPADYFTNRPADDGYVSRG